MAYRSRRHDVAYYVRLGRLSGGPVLEYGVGTGRIAIELARHGVEVVGVDRSVAMLNALAEKLDAESRETRARVRIVRGDMRKVRLRRRFPLVIAPFNTILHLYERRDIEQFFTCVRAHLTPRGRFVFDFSVPWPADLAADPRRSYGQPRFRHPTAGVVRYAERFEYDPIRQILLVHMDFVPIDGGPAWSVPLTHRQFFPQEMEALLHYGGFVDLQVTADFTDAMPTSDSDSLVVSARSRR